MILQWKMKILRLKMMIPLDVITDCCSTSAAISTATRFPGLLNLVSLSGDVQINSAGSTIPDLLATDIDVLV